MTILALDVGAKRIGAAVSDPLGITAQGIPTITYKDDETVFNKLKEIIKEHSVTKIVIGLPMNLDGSLGRQAEFVLDFLNKLKKELPQEIETWDERFSSKGVERILQDAGVRGQERKSKLDKLSAQWILQGYLERLRHE